VTRYNSPISTNGPEFGTRFASDEDSDPERPDLEAIGKEKKKILLT
jgi:hypothetical protein